jgi:hypothetical protein
VLAASVIARMAASVACCHPPMPRRPRPHPAPSDDRSHPPRRQASNRRKPCEHSEAANSVKKGNTPNLSTGYQAAGHKGPRKSTVNCGFSALVKRQHLFYFGVCSLSEWGHHEESRRWNRSDPRDPEPCRLCSSGQGQSATAGRDQGLAQACLRGCRLVGLAAAVELRSTAIAGSGLPWYFDLLLRVGIT